jgi:hypothetical protein
MNSLTAQIITPRKAYLTWILYLLAPSPAILASLYTEPLFACLTFSGFGWSYDGDITLLRSSWVGLLQYELLGFLLLPHLLPWQSFETVNIGYHCL